jgi:Zn-dependent metalloprotease
MSELGIPLFNSLKIDLRRVHRQHDPDTGLVSRIDGFLSAAGEGSPADVARQFLRENYRRLAGRRSLLREVEVEDVSQSPAGYHVRLQQTRQGVPVHNATVSVHLTRDKRVHAAQSRLRPKAAQLDVQAMAADGIDEGEAKDIALDYLSARQDPTVPLEAEPVVLADEELLLAWKVSLSTRDPAQDWVFMIDSKSGEVLAADERSQS